MKPSSNYKLSKNSQFWAYLAISCVIFLLSACSSISSSQPDLEKLYSIQKGNPAQPPIILIHGLTGSRLKSSETGKERWPGPLNKLLFSDYSYLANQIDSKSLEIKPSTLEVAGITDTAVGKDFYGKIIETLTTAGHYQPANLSIPSPKRQSLYVFTYDWRQDNVESARELHKFIQDVKLKYDDPNLKVDIVAHSMGGLIARYYIRYGTQDVLNSNDFPVNNFGADHVRRIILLGTPNFGSIGSIDAFTNGSKVGLNRIPPEVLVSFPSMYQLFPHALNDWLLGINGQALNLDVFDIDIWRRLKLSIFDPDRKRKLEARDLKNEAGNSFKTLEAFMQKQLERGRRFTWSLTVPLPETKVSYIVFGGNCELTPARALLEELNDGTLAVRFNPAQISKPRKGINYDQLLLEPGDGTVTKASLLARQTYDPTIQRHKYSNFPLDYSFFLCEAHDALTGNISFQDNLLNVLLSADENRVN